MSTVSVQVVQVRVVIDLAVLSMLARLSVD